jgi:archaellum component FlaC
MIQNGDENFINFNLLDKHVGNLDKRVENLESTVKNLEKTVNDVRIDVAKFDAKFSEKFQSLEGKFQFYATKEDLEKQANATRRTYYRVTGFLAAVIFATNPSIINVAQTLLEFLKKLHS